MKRSQEQNKILERKLNIASIIVSLVVLALVVMMRRVKIDLGVDFSFLPLLHAILNSCAAICLIFALRAVKSKNFKAHEKWIYAAIGFSVTFLLSYVLYHFTTEETLYCKEGFIRGIYFFFLISHIILAAVILPFILFTFTRAYTEQFERHKRMAKWVFPIWFYVAVTGPIIYFMLAPCY